MDAPELPPPPPPAPVRRLTRRRLLQLAGGAAALGLGAEVLRVVVRTNEHTVIPGRVYRTAQLKPDQLRELIADKGVRTVVNLRGVCTDTAWYLGECRTTHAANVNQEDITFSAKRFPAPAEVRRLVEVLDHTAYPIVFHCQRGADRTGLASTVAVLLHTDADLATARRQLWPRYGHVAVGRTAVLDAFFDYYEAWLARRGEPHAPDRFRRWVNTDYCPGPYRAELTLAGGTRFPTGQGLRVAVRARNTSIEPWRFTTGRGGIRLCHTVTAADGTNMYRSYSGHFARVVPPGEAVEFACGVPPLPPGAYQFHADLIDGEPIELLDTAFVQYGSEPLAVPLTIS
ncbi:tyrosine-protein phosphatase [Gemmata sp. JC673]|uniref:Tyrosine-protein phosphatase n=1 Tax=Gemmata algarum TaxID=2975278 RepID=A0ABU5EWM9_9BACT|nr:tyrosine-protein phosphatase [Gemmata algarum]MDY3558238.1 tyrosine-protein phosphatase [Gemmata algarum]